MSKIINKWTEENKEHEQYACIIGFEEALREYDTLSEVYDEMDHMAKIDLFVFVTKLLEEDSV